ncbi:TIGR02646 family protein [Beggiatoa alba B18LD]|uniref:TIGR02646 family protein n=1 Tax=Beggiatoa alba B18LD TaxID=395493 RepID=I3CCM0_9GAMM|nr:retron system putative HNH endonuclease [Beggiatoa alba]EIJ41363.1 TIGR02646 family protein [Beggiatoa alba B18LD]
MRRIYKTPCPALSDFIKQEKDKKIDPVYKNGLDSKEEYKQHFFNLRKQLLEEQGYICCYCQSRINLVENEMPKMKVEHFKPKSKYKDLELDYRNLLASCLGNSNSETHCDSKKLGKELEEVPNPESKEFEQFKIKYIAYKITANTQGKESDKYISVMPLWNEKIKQAKAENKEEDKIGLEKNDPLTGIEEGCLNLNHQTLMSRRFGAWQGVSNIFYKKIGKNWHIEKGKKLATDLIEYYNKTNDRGELKEFCQVIIDLLKKEFKV